MEERKINPYDRSPEEISLNMKAVVDTRADIDHSNKVVDDLINMGASARRILKEDQQSLKITGEKLSLSNKVYHSTVSMMNTIKKQELKHTVIIACVIAICICFFLWYAIL
eukprot:TRINITY_DN2455_c0_g1_i1.p1 TRINITY_DN2455_c0_g1~~TRINITY_DN2455_c0_g1_i1.p1  ORF type:complete len:111 (-),score=19.58 TRINITY_DN2455_c0_g1_i1:42-374(-)